MSGRKGQVVGHTAMFGCPQRLEGRGQSYEIWGLTLSGIREVLIVQMLCDHTEDRGMVPRSGCGFTKNPPAALTCICVTNLIGQRN